MTIVTKHRQMLAARNSADRELLKNLGLVPGAKVQVIRGRKYQIGKVGILINFMRNADWGRRARVLFEGEVKPVGVALHNLAGYINHTPSKGALVKHINSKCYCTVVDVSENEELLSVLSVCPDRCYVGYVGMHEITHVIKRR